MILFHPVFSQTADTNYIKQLYDRSLDFSEDRIDSLQANAAFIEAASQKLNYSNGLILSNRLKGLVEEFSGNYEGAIQYYLQTLEDSRAAQVVDYEIAALSDLAIAYSTVKQYEKAKEVYHQSLQLSLKRGEASSLINGLGNLGAIYNLLNNTDSALIVLEEAERLCSLYQATAPLPSIYNNLGNVYFKKKNYVKALGYFNSNLRFHTETNDPSGLWTDYLNLGDLYLQMGKLDSSMYYLNLSLKIALELHSRPKEADSYGMLAKLEERKGNFQKALNFQRKWYQLDTALVNQESASAIAEMQERYNAKDREKRNLLLQTAIEKEQLKNQQLKLLSVAVIIIVILISFILMVYRNTNKKLTNVNTVINRQKEALSSLNQEKNSLISMVSHDLSTPFSSIHLWSRLLENEKNLGPEEKRAAENIRRAAESGEKMIRRILEIERVGTSMEKLELEEVQLAAFLCHICQQFSAVAAEKNITVLGPDPANGYCLLTDQSLLQRIVENLLSNAIKFSEPGTTVKLWVEEEDNVIAVHVDDEGPGIHPEEQQLLFSKYARLSVKPTAGEASTGLGLSIVKRLVNELNASLHYLQLPEKGSRFTVRFKK